MPDMILLSDVLVGVMGTIRRRHSSAAFACVGHHALNMLVRHGFGSTSRRLVNRRSIHLVVSRRRRLELLCGLLVPPPIHRVALLRRTVVLRVLVLRRIRAILAARYKPAVVAEWSESLS